MRRTRSPWSALNSFAVSNALLCAALVVGARAETRPHYGGTLRVETQAAINTLPKLGDIPENHLSEQIVELLYGGTFQACYGGSCSNRPGAFRVGEFVAGKKLTLVANDGYEGGRPYVDAIEIQMGKGPREQMVAFQLGRADVVEVPAEAVRRASQEGVRLVTSSPVELIAIVFSAKGGEDTARLREAVSLTVDRAAIFNVLLGRQGEPTAALLPNWMTGYGFLFDASQNVTRARQLAGDAKRARPLTLAYDPQDTLARAIAERVALDARAAGINIAPTTAANDPDMKLVRITLSASDPQTALSALAAGFGVSAPASADSPEELYQAERKLRDDLRIVPLLHLPLAYGIGPHVKNWAPSRGASWALEDIWLEQKP